LFISDDDTVGPNASQFTLITSYKEVEDWLGNKRKIFTYSGNKREMFTHTHTKALDLMLYPWWKYGTFTPAPVQTSPGSHQASSSGYWILAEGTMAVM
jgi:hypothetical protein